MPAATPVPHGPSVLTLYGAEDLLTAPGCPVCRYAGEAGDRYFGWFALEGHAQPQMIATLGGSLGMCAAHSRRLMGQPGAAVRLTAVYRYVIVAARDRLANGTAVVAACPACEHDHASSGRALETLLDGLDDGSATERCRDLGGLCIPHLAVATGRARRRVVAWLGETMRESLIAADIGWLAGADHDSATRAVLRELIPAAGAPVPGVCSACLAAARAERDCLARLSARVGAGPVNDAQTGPPMCAGHLADAAASAAKAGGLAALLVEQAAAIIARTGTATGRPRRRLAVRLHGGPPNCPVCLVRGEAGHRALAAMARTLQESPLDTYRRQPLCARHHLALLAVGKQVGVVAARAAAEAADALARELTEEFERTTWAGGRGARAPEPAAWRRAAAFLDGAVFGGPPRS